MFATVSQSRSDNRPEPGVIRGRALGLGDRAAAPALSELAAVTARRGPGLQARLELGRSDDPLEHEADRVAERLTAATPGRLQRACACGGTPGPDGECAACRARRLGMQRKPAAAGPGQAPAIVHDVLRSPGRPLEPSTRAAMEHGLGRDLGAVRVHTDSRAAASARAVDALAYTVGSDIVFAQGRHAPGTREGRRLLAHELAHVLQQRGGTALLQRQAIAPTCNGVTFDPATQRCCEDVILSGAAPFVPGCASPTTRDNEYDGCSVPDQLLAEGEDRNNPGGAYDTWFSDPAIHGTKPQSFEPTLPCDVHDKCYQTCGADWGRCNEELFQAANAICERSRQRRGSAAYELCMYGAWKGETLLPVRVPFIGSQVAFAQRQQEYCACCSDTRRAEAQIFFEYASSDLDTAAEIDITAFVLANEPLLTAVRHELAIIGHASRTGSDATNQALAEQRVKAVRAAIVARLSGPLTNVVEAPFGEQLAAAEARPPADDRWADRRVDLVLTAR